MRADPGGRVATGAGARPDGDIIWTGTPTGVSPSRPGDVAEEEVEGVGGQRTFIER